jgi:hypothetical protein
VTYQPPYRFGAPVEAPFFCDREEQLDVIVNRMKSGIHVFLLSPRRYGKTSLLTRAAQLVERDGGRCAYVNLMFCTTEAELASAIMTAVVKSTLSGPGRAKHRLEDLVRRIRIKPGVRIDENGSATLTFDPRISSQDWVSVLHDAVAILEDSNSKGPAALILDEFQVVANIGPRGVGGTFKGVADQAKSTCLAFSGSHLSIMEELTKGNGAPLHGMGERIFLEVVPETPMVKYLIQRAKKSGKQLSTKNAELIYREAGAIPNFVQQLALAAFEVSGDEITLADVVLGAQAIVDRQGGDFAERYEQLAPSQQRILRLLAIEARSAVYAKVFLDEIGVANANAVRKALQVLSGRELVQRLNSEWSVSDPFLRQWLRRSSD